MKDVEILGIYGATLRPCSVCDISDLGAKLQREQASEATDTARSDSDLAYRIASAAFARYGNAVRIRLTPLDSPRGLWLTFRHRLGGGLQVLVNGRKTAPDPQKVLAALA